MSMASSYSSSLSTKLPPIVIEPNRKERGTTTKSSKNRLSGLGKRLIFLVLVVKVIWLDYKLWSISSKESNEGNSISNNNNNNNGKSLPLLSVPTQGHSRENIKKDQRISLKHNASSIIPISQKKKQEQDVGKYGSMAACLYVNDENHRLLEWIPYHYYVAGVRRIIITNTPHSTSTPRPILDRWKDRIHITLWNEHGPTDFPMESSKISPYESHKSNQQTFLANCHTALKREGWNWAFALDVDEYLVINHRVRKQGTGLYHLNISSSSSDHHHHLIIPAQREVSSIPKFLQRVEPFRHSQRSRFLHTRPCLQYTRIQFSNKPTTNTHFFKGIMLDTSQMNTFRWLWRRDPKILAGKGIAELARVSYEDISNYTTPHYPVGNFEDLCVKDDLWIKEFASPLLIHHYPASWSELLARNSTPMAVKYAIKTNVDRKNMTALLEYRFQLEAKNSHRKEPGQIQDWLPGFIDFVGREEAKRVLQHVGNMDMAKLGAKITWGQHYFF